MTRILRIDSSSRLQGSHSREIADHFQAAWLNKYPQDEVVIRDVVETPLPHISNTTIAGFNIPDKQQTAEVKQAIALSDELINELQTSDVLLMSVPMYNFSVPSALKAWIDQIVRPNRTFAYDGTSFTGLLQVKRAYIICAYGGGGYVDGGFAGFNFLQPYLKSLFSFVGISEIEFFHLQGTTTEDKATVTKNINQIKTAISNSLSAI